MEDESNAHKREHIDIVNEYCMKCTLYGKEFHYLSHKLHDCVEHYCLLTQGLDDVSITEKYKKR